MVPVPEELAPKVISYVNWKGNPQLRKLMDDSAAPPEREVQGEAEGEAAASDPIGRAYARLDDQSRQLLAVIADASLAGASLTVPEAAGRAGLTARELIGVVTEINNRIAAEGGSMMSVVVWRHEDADDVAFTWQKRVIRMSDAVARTISELTQAPPGA